MQALGNIVGNAIKFTPEGGRVRIALDVLPDRYAVRVSDTGLGINPEHADNIFRPFWQAPGAKHGSGLGLAIARGIVEAHGGQIMVEGSSTPGATIVFSLPSTEKHTGSSA